MRARPHSPHPDPWEKGKKKKKKPKPQPSLPHPHVHIVPHSTTPAHTPALLSRSSLPPAAAALGPSPSAGPVGVGVGFGRAEAPAVLVAAPVARGVGICATMVSPCAALALAGVYGVEGGGKAHSPMMLLMCTRAGSAQGWPCQSSVGRSGEQRTADTAEKGRREGGLTRVVRVLRHAARTKPRHGPHVEAAVVAQA